MPRLDSPAVRIAGACVVVLLLFLYIRGQVLPLVSDGGTGVPGIVSHQNDYKHVYLGARLLSMGFSPYEAEVMLPFASTMAETEDIRFWAVNPYVYPPFTALVMRPLTWLPFAQSAVAFIWLNNLALLGALLLAAWCMGWRGHPWVAAGLLAMVAWSDVVTRQNNAGQLNVVLLLGYTMVLVAMKRRWPAPAVGAMAGFLALFKLSPGILLVWFLLRREWRHAGWMAGFGLLFTLSSALIYGWQAHWNFLPVLRDMGYGSSTWGEYGNTFWRDPYNQSFNALFHRLLAGDPRGVMEPWLALGPVAANALTWVATVGILGAFGWVAWGRRAPLEASFAAMVMASLLLPALFWDHYLVQAYLPAVVLLALGAGMEGPRRWVVWGGVGVSLVLMAWPIRFGSLDWNGGGALLLHNVKLLPALILFAVALWMGVRPHGEKMMLAANPAP